MQQIEELEVVKEICFDFFFKEVCLQFDMRSIVFCFKKRKVLVYFRLREEIQKGQKKEKESMCRRIIFFKNIFYISY